MLLPTRGSGLAEMLREQKYQLIGRKATAAVKKCYWLHVALTGGSFCYKSWYGIESHRCVQMTPTLACPNSCLHCWRVERGDPGVSALDEGALVSEDREEELLQQAIKAQHRILSGYKSNPKVVGERYVEALHPKHFAISLAGEPTLYARLGNFIDLCRRKGFTTFLVTNGMYPKQLAQLVDGGQPSQLYVSVNASSEEMFKQLARSSLTDGWRRLLESLEMLEGFKCPTVIRVTLIRGINDRQSNVDGFAEVIKRAKPWYVEVKGYMYLGYSRLRLKVDNMPKHAEILRFARSMARATGYQLVAENLPSRVALLSRVGDPVKVRP
ncbi:MAG: 4-demethylwyosine synthase TYW1 [Candidatus Nezhaarchaeota archaeon]|nr:4-demethylwyosine synthase TYW1 [Candidatus Nezhaarchaeota archaeon]